MAKKKTEEPLKEVRKPTKTQPEVLYTLCVPSTIISQSNAKNLEQITSIAYQIAKIATIYGVGEIVVLDIPSLSKRAEIEEKKSKVVLVGSTDKGGKKITFNDDMDDVIDSTPAETAQEEASEEAGSDPAVQSNENNALLFASLLQYFITPPYLASSLFASSVYSKKFKYAKNMPKISTLPFMSNNEVSRDFREGLTVPKHTPKVLNKVTKKKISPKNKLLTTKYVNVGLGELLELNSNEIPVNVRVTVDMKNKKIISPAEAYGVVGRKSTFGYHVRVAKTFSSVFTESSVPEGYSSSIYVKSDDYFEAGKKQNAESELETLTREQVHVKGGNILLILGNWLDLEYSFCQEELEGVEKVGQMFDGEIKVPSGVKIEDAAMIGLTRVYLE